MVGFCDLVGTDIAPVSKKKTAVKLVLVELALEDLSLEDPSKEYHFDDCEEKAHLLIHYFVNVIFERLSFARGY